MMSHLSILVMIWFLLNRISTNELLCGQKLFDAGSSYSTTSRTLAKITVEMLGAKGVVERYSLDSISTIKYFSQVLLKSSANVRLIIAAGYHPELALHLQPSSLQFTKGFVQKYFDESSGEPIVKQIHDSSANPFTHCYFNGEVERANQSQVSLSLCNGVRGAIQVYQQVFLIEPVQQDGKIWHEVVEKVENETDPHNYQTCTSEGKHFHSTAYTPVSSPSRTRRNVHPQNASLVSRYIELYIVMDYYVYKNLGSVEKTIERAIDVVNLVSYVYRSLDIYIALVGVEVWNTGNQITYPRFRGNPSETDSHGLLTNFAKYRFNKINTLVQNDNAQLLADVDLNEYTIGYAYVGGICERRYSAGVIWYNVTKGIVFTAFIVGHEMGHNIGFQHTNMATCQAILRSYQADKYIMDAVIRIPPATKWSPCSFMAYETNFEKNMYHCLTDLPNVLTQTICGNYLVEEGEECDCGKEEYCESKCCDAKTCTLKSEAQCASGPCCDLELCTFKKRHTLCRPLQDTECDLEEVCDGKSEWCPTDTYKQDGVACVNISDAYCYKGTCDSHNSQCQFIWDVDSIKNSDDICYYEFNNLGTYAGNCGWSIDRDSPYGHRITKKYHSCKTREDQLCGMLLCQYDEYPQRTYTAENFRIKNRVLDGPINSRIGTKLCAGSSFDTGDKFRDLGLVPNGAKCGENRMCVETVCTQVKALSADCKCNGRGVCNQYGECHCEAGWAPPLCITRGFGGSRSSTSNTIQVNTGSLTLILIVVIGTLSMVITVALVVRRRKKSIQKFLHGTSNGKKKTVKSKKTVNTPKTLTAGDSSKTSTIKQTSATSSKSVGAKTSVSEKDPSTDTKSQLSVKSRNSTKRRLSAKRTRSSKKKEILQT